LEKVKLKKYLEADRKIEVRLQGDEGKYYKSMIQGVKNELLLIAAPYRGKDNLHLYKGDSVDVILVAHSEKILFSAQVVGRFNKPFFGYVLQTPEEGKRIQLREFVRIKLLLDAEWGLVEDTNVSDEDLEQIEFNEAVMVDLSGGGAGLVIHEPLPEDTRLLLRFTLPLKNSERVMSVMAEVRRCFRMDEPNKYALGVSFVGLSAREQDQIVEYVFQKQREQRLMGDGVN
jgi:c-di-GMP-binding flagellar brake protein YcgR